jgi:hypothetical protein
LKKTKEDFDMKMEPEAMLYIAAGSTCLVTAGVFFVRSRLKKLTQDKRLKRSIVQDKETWNKLMQMKVSDFLIYLGEDALPSLKDSENQPTMSPARLRVAIVERRKGLQDREEPCKREYTLRLMLMGNISAETAQFIRGKLIDGDPKCFHRNKLKIWETLIPYLTDEATSLERIAGDPKSLFKKGDLFSFNEIFTLLTEDTRFMGAKSALREKAQKLYKELRVSWDNLLVAKTRRDQFESDLEKWIMFGEENSESLAEVLNNMSEWWSE